MHPLQIVSYFRHTRTHTHTVHTRRHKMKHFDACLMAGFPTHARLLYEQPVCCHFRILFCILFKSLPPVPVSPKKNTPTERMKSFPTLKKNWRCCQYQGGVDGARVFRKKFPFFTAIIRWGTARVSSSINNHHHQHPSCRWWSVVSLSVLLSIRLDRSHGRARGVGRAGYHVQFYTLS